MSIGGSIGGAVKAIGNAFRFDFGQVADTAKKFAQQSKLTEQEHSIVKTFGPKIQAAWIGGDADEHAADIVRKLNPLYIEFAAAFKGVELNLTKASQAASSADSAANKLANGFMDLCKNIFKL